MKPKIKKIIKTIWGTENNILLKANLSCFFTGVLFCALALTFQTEYPSQPTTIFSYLSAILFNIWLITMDTQEKPWGIFKEFFRLIAFFLILIYSLNFCINLSVLYNGLKLIMYSILSCLGIFACFLYLISKFIDIFNFTKKIFKQLKQRLFNSVQPATSKLKTLIENITAFLVAIAGLGVAIKTIIEPLINFIK